VNQGGSSPELLKRNMHFVQTASLDEETDQGKSSLDLMKDNTQFISIVPSVISSRALLCQDACYSLRPLSTCSKETPQQWLSNLASRKSDPGRMAPAAGVSRMRRTVTAVSHTFQKGKGPCVESRSPANFAMNWDLRSTRGRDCQLKHSLGWPHLYWRGG
jgi:hypothetical protein